VAILVIVPVWMLILGLVWAMCLAARAGDRGERSAFAAKARAAVPVVGRLRDAA
jgi:hypothetical protein